MSQGAAGSGARRRRRAERAAAVTLPLAAIPRATYRVQLHREFTFNDVTTLVPYLATLGVSHVYCSPYLRARSGSLHGYDIVDHRALNPELGTSADFDRMVDTLARHGMSHLCDVVPNHMAVMGVDNAWWMDVVENGPSSDYADFFDIDWAPQDPDLALKVLIPVLGDPYGAVLERGEVTLAFEPARGAFSVRYFADRFPLDPATCAPLVADALGEVRDKLGRDVVSEVERVVAALETLPARHERRAPVGPESRTTAASAATQSARATATYGAQSERNAERRRKASEAKARLAGLVVRHMELRKAIDAIVEKVNGEPADPASFDALHALLEAQPFRLTHWRVASDEINYRRFFDINELAALRMENERVFEATHAFILGLAADGAIGGLRIDHPDGLFDPAAYFRRLQEGYRQRVEKRGTLTAGIYVVAEKIAAAHERVPEDWPIHGTTGYRFLNLVNGLFVDRAAKGRLDRTWRAFAGDEAYTYEQAAYRGRRVIMEGQLASELAVLARRALRVARGDRRTRDLTFNSLREAIKETVARFPVYRTYVDEHGASAQDKRYVDWAVARARAYGRTSDPRVFDFLHNLMLGIAPQDATADCAARYRRFAMRFQQFTAPVAAKGVEDTAFYTFNRLMSVNEVGGDPDQFGITVRAFHGASKHRAAVWPHTMLATSTHDNKRSEDTRTRIDVLSEMPARWRLAVRRWSRMNRGRKRIVDEQAAPSRNDEYLLYQTLIATFPPYEMDKAMLAAYRERIDRYALKAVREAKVRTSWLAINAPYEEALRAFVEALLPTSEQTPFLADLRAQSAVIAWFGMLNSLSMTLLKLASPGVPDVYQGNELLDFSLVDPDNRHEVDYAARRARLATLERLAEDISAQRQAARALFASPYDGRAKLWVIWRALALRREHAALFAYGSYRPIAVTGAHAERVVAFARIHEEEIIVAVAGRFFVAMGLDAGDLPLGDVWRDTALDLAFVAPGARFVDVLSGGILTYDGARVPLARVCTDFPVALLYFARAPSGMQR